MKLYTKEWTKQDFKKVEKAIHKHFAGRTLKNHRNKNIYFDLNFRAIENILGLPYTSSGVHPQIALDCNIHVFPEGETKFHYDFVVMDQDKKVIFILSDENENRKIIKQ